MPNKISRKAASRVLKRRRASDADFRKKTGYHMSDAPHRKKYRKALKDITKPRE